MSDDRLDDAIDAVIRAVDSIERATRGGQRAAGARVEHGSRAGSDEAPAAVHELVGRIVARSRELDDHLAAARGLREEIDVLAGRLAGASIQQH